MNWLNLWGVVSMLFFFGLSIFVHELGHFLAAKYFRLWVPCFSLGFGKKIFSWRWRGTEFRLALIPLGGYVTLPQLADMKDVEGDYGTLPDGYERQISFSARLWVTLMGPFFNLLFAFLLAVLLWFIGRPVLQSDRTQVVGAIPATVSLEGKVAINPLVTTRIVPGDEIVEVDGHAVKSFSEILSRVAFGTRHDEENRPVSLWTVRRNSEVFPEQIRVFPTTSSPRNVFLFPAQPLVIWKTLANSPAEESGLLVGDEILSLNGEQMYSPAMFNQRLETTCGPVSLKIFRDGKPMNITVEPRLVPICREFLEARWKNQRVILSAEGDRYRVLSGPKNWCNRSMSADDLDHNFSDLTFHGVEFRPLLGILFETPTVLLHQNPFSAFGETVTSSLQTVSSLFNYHSDLGVRHLMGVPGIARVLHRLTVTNFRLLLWFVMVLNVGLAILNLLPFPVLDGGQVVYALIQRKTCNPVVIKVLNWVQSIFLLLLFGLMIYIAYRDIVRWGSDRRAAEELKALQSLRIENPFNSKGQ